MSLAASQARLIMLTRYKSDMEYEMGMITQEQEELVFKSQQCSEDPDAVAFFHYQSRDLELQLKNMDTQMKVITQDCESTQKMVDDGAKRAGSYGANA